MDTSNNSNTISVTCVLLERKIRYALGCTPNSVQEMAPKQTIHQTGRARVPRTPRKTPVRKTTPQTAD